MGQEKAAPIIDALHALMTAQRQLVPEGSAIAKELNYSLKRWIALSRYLDDGSVPIDNNRIEIRPGFGHLGTLTGYPQARYAAENRF